MKILLVIVALAAICGAELPEAPQPRILDKKFMLVEGVAAASVALDAYTTTAIKRPCYETNPILGRHPSTLETAAYMTGRFAGITAIHYFGRKMHMGQRFHGAVWAVPTFYFSFEHAYAGVHNVFFSCS